MDNCEVFDNVKFEKAKAMARYNKFQNMMKMLQVFEVFVAIILISWSWSRIPAAVTVSSQFLIQVSRWLFKPQVAFVISNVIIVAVVILCRQTDNNDIDNEPIVSDLPVPSPALSSETQEPSVVVTAEEKHVVPSECKVLVTQCHDVATVIDTATKRIQKFKRTQSEKLKREIKTSTPRELRRSETERRRKLNVPVDTLSNEDFRLTIEAFIKKNQVFFEKQRLAEAEPEKYERIGIEAF